MASNYKVPQPLYCVVLQSHVKNENHYISTTRMSVATKLGRMVVHLDLLLPKKLHGPLITLSCEIKSQAKTIIYLHYHSAYGNETW